MTYPNVESPVMGGKLRAGWGASVSSAIDAHEADLQSLRQPDKWKSLRGDDVPLKPFAVRHHKTEDDEDGQWEIWLPPGCMSVGRSCEPINKAASEKSGHEDDADGWYALRLDESEGEPTRTETVENEDGEPVTVAIREFTIAAHAKTSAKMEGIDDLDAPARRLLYVDARKVPSEAEASNVSDEDSMKGKWGDEFAQTVATVIISTGGGKTSRRIIARRDTPISVAARERTNFDLVWYFGFDSAGALEVTRLYCVRQTAAAAGITITGDTMIDVRNAEKIYARIDATNMNDGNGIVQVLKDPQGVNISSPYVVWLHLYDMTSNVVEADYRQQSLVNLQLFHA